MNTFTPAGSGSSLDPATGLMEEILNDFARSESADLVGQEVFGDNWKTGGQLPLNRWAAGDFSNLPEIEILSGESLGGASAAFSAQTGAVYVSSSFLATATNAELAAVLIEEVGHWVDARINLKDTPGDEGEIFSALLRGVPVNQAALTQNDHGTIPVNGQDIAAEFSDSDIITQSQILKMKLGVANAFLPLDAVIAADTLTKSLPIVGDQIAGLGEVPGLTYAKTIRETIYEALDTLATAPEYGASQLEQLLNGSAIFQAAGITADVVADFSSASINIIPNKTFQLLDVPLAPNFGLPGIDLSLKGAGSADVSLGYSGNLKFGVDGGKVDPQFFVDTTAENELAIQLTTSLPGFNQELQLALLNFRATDNGTTFNPVFGMDFQDVDGTNDGKLRTFGNFIDATISGDAEIRLMLTGDMGSSAMPSLNTELNYGWSFDRDLLASSGVAPNFQPIDSAGFDLESFGDIPQIAFNNVSFNLGSFFGNFVDPVFGYLSDVLEPFEPLLDVLTADLPLLSDLHHLALENLGVDVVPKTLVDLGVYRGDISPETALAIKAAAQFVNSINTTAIPNGAGLSQNIMLGSFQLDGYDARDSSAKLEDAVANIQQELNALTQNAQLGNFVINLKNQSNNPGLVGEGLKFDIIENPATAFNLLLGKDVNLFTYDMDQIELADFSLDTFIPIIGPLGARIELGVSALLDLDFGYDTSGLRKYALEGGDATDVLDGFFIKVPSSGGVFEFEAKASVAAELNAVVAAAGAGGGIVGYGVVNPVSDAPGKAYVSNVIGNLLSSDPFSAFTAYGGAYFDFFVYATLGVGEFGITWEKSLARGELFDFGTPPVEDVSKYFRYDLVGGFPGNTLRLVRADESYPSADGAMDEIFIEKVEGDFAEEIIKYRYSFRPFVSDFSGSEFKVGDAGISANSGEIYPNQNVIAYHGGKWNDRIELDEDIYTPAHLEGGPDNDTLIGALGADTLEGGDGIDLLVGREGNDQLFGDADNDMLDGGRGNNTLDGGDGSDTATFADRIEEINVTLQNSGDTQFTWTYVVNRLSDGTPNAVAHYQQTLRNIENIIGGSADDSIIGNAQDNHFYGGEGKDYLHGGDGNDHIEGGPDQDTLVGGAGDDTLSYYRSELPVYVELDTAIAVVDGKVDSIGGFESLWGTNLSDTLGGDHAGNDIWGAGGNDTIAGLGGNDALDGGAGDDSISGGDGLDLVFGSDGNDFLDAGADADIIGGGPGNDWIIAGGGNDAAAGDYRFLEKPGSNTLIPQGQELAPQGDDTIDGGEGDDTIEGGGGDDLIIVGEDSNFAYGGFSGVSPFAPGASDGNDYIIAAFAAGDNFLDGGTGINRLAADYSDQLWYSIHFISGQTNHIEFPLTNPNEKALNFQKIGAFFYTGAKDDVVRIDGAADDNFSNDIRTGFGNDYVTAGGGKDTVYGGDDNDTIDGGTGDDTIFGEEGDDSVVGGAGADWLDGGTGTDLIDYSLSEAGVNVNLANTLALATGGHAQDDAVFNFEQILGSAFGDVIRLAGRPGSYAFGDSGNDSIQGAELADTIEGGSGNDTLHGLEGDNLIRGGADHDYISTLGGNDTIYGDEGNDTINVGDGLNLIFGGLGNDSITSGLGNDIITGGEGSDTISAGEGHNQVDAGEGGNTVTAGAGDDTVTSGTGVDTISVSDGDNIVTASDGNKTITAGTGDDTVTSGTGNDHIQVSDGINIVSSGTGNDTVVSGSGNDTVDAGADNDSVQTGAGNDTVTAGSGNDFVDLGVGTDSVLGGTGNDVLHAGNLRGLVQDEERNDTLLGGEGFDAVGIDFSNQVGAFDITAGNTHTYIFADGARATDFETVHDFATSSGDYDDFLKLDGPNDDGFDNYLSVFGGNNTVYSGRGNDTVIAGAGDDYVNTGNNTIALVFTNGGGVIDALASGGGAEIFVGADGDDTISFDQMQRTANFSAGGATTVYEMGVGINLATGVGSRAAAGVTATGFEHVIGTNLADNLVGTSGDNVIMPLRGGGTFSTYFGVRTQGGQTDSVDGEGGIDTLRIDYSVDDGNGLGGLVSSPGNLQDGTFYRFLPTNGSGFATVDVRDGVVFSDIEIFEITGTSFADDIESGHWGYNDTLIGLGGNDTIIGRGGSDSLLGGDGNDVLIGSQAGYNVNRMNGRDFLDGGAGNDFVDNFYQFVQGTDHIPLAGFYSQLDGGSGFDTVSANFALLNEDIIWSSADPTDIVFEDGQYAKGFEQISSFVAGGGDDAISQLGRVSNYSIHLGAGDDTLNAGLGVDTNLNGGDGNDLLIVDYSVGDDGTAVNGTGGAVQRGNGSLDRTINVTGFERFQITGTAQNDTLNGGNGTSDTIFGGAGNDSIDGSSGLKYFDGGDGDDTLRGSNVAGNADTLIGGAGNDLLDGRSIGSDSLVGGDGNDRLLLTSGGTAVYLQDFADGGAGDDVVENFAGAATILSRYGTANAYTVGALLRLDGGSGSDTLSADFSNQTQAIIWDQNAPTNIDFSDGAYFRNFEFLKGFASGSGNDSILLSGRTDNDIFLANGDDTVNAGLGKDSLYGGNGTDLLIVDFSADDSVNLNGVTSSTGFFTRTNTSNVVVDQVTSNGFESYSITGAGKADRLLGHTSADTLIGNAGNDTLEGISGNDSLVGGDGNDSLIVETSSVYGTDYADGGAGDDFIKAGFVSQNLNFATATSFQYLDGGDGMDTLSADFGNQSEAIVFQQGISNSRVFANGTYFKNVEVLADFASGSGNDSIHLAGRANNTIYLGVGDDTLNPGLGIDAVNGVGGNDLLILDYSLGDDTNVGGLVGNTNTIFRRNTTTNANVDSITFQGFERLHITGGSKADTLLGGTGNDSIGGGAGNDSISGGSGADLLAGGLGDDTISVDNSGDTAVELAGSGTDLIVLEALLSYSLAPNIENGTISSVTGAASLTGNNSANVLTGNAGSNQLFGLRGDDVLIGDGTATRGSGQRDTLTGGLGADWFIVGTPAGRLYDDNNPATMGTGDYVLIADFNPLQGDRLRLSGIAEQYFLGASPVVGVSGTGLFFDSNASGVMDSTDELVAVVRSPSTLTSSNLVATAQFV